jgi:DNA-binding PadR family transcriptional regulator
MQELEQRSRGLWRPSPGSVYPALQQLEDQGLIRAQDAGAGRVYQLTDDGRKQVDAFDDESRAPWEAVAGADDDEMLDHMSVFRSVALASTQVFRAGTPAQRKQARKILFDAQRALYRVLAEDPPEDA